MPTVVTPTIAPVGTGVTRLTYWQALADALGSWHETVVSETATSGEAARYVLADELRDDEAGYEHLGAGWLYVRTGDQAGTQRRIVSRPEVGYQGPDGAVMLSRPLDGVVEAGSVVDVTNPFPVLRHLGVKGLVTCVDEALACCRVEARITFTGNGGYGYSLAAYPWLRHVGQTAGIYDNQYLIVDTPNVINPSSTYTIAANGVDRTLVTMNSYAADQTFDLAVLVRGDQLVYDGATWSYPTTPGLQGDDWQAAASEHWVLAFGMVKALDALTRLVRQRRDLSREDKAEWMAEILESRKVWYRAARRIQVYELPKPPAARSEPMVGRAPMSGDTGAWW